MTALLPIDELDEIAADRDQTINVSLHDGDLQTASLLAAEGIRTAIGWDQSRRRNMELVHLYAGVSTNWPDLPQTTRGPADALYDQVDVGRALRLARRVADDIAQAGVSEALGPAYVLLRQAIDDGTRHHGTDRVVGGRIDGGDFPFAAAAHHLEDWLQPAPLLMTGDIPDVDWVAERLIVAGTTLAIQGAPKAGKTWLILELGVCIPSGRSVLGRYPVPQPGPVILVLEESSVTATRRRLGQIAIGHGLNPADLVDLHIASNRGLRLDDESWLDRLRNAIDVVRPRLLLIDPLVRAKGAASEDKQEEMGPALDWLARVSHETDTAVGFTHHVGHTEQHRMRGTSDLEAWWGTKLSLKRAKGGTVTLSAQHREAEDTPVAEYRLLSDPTTGAVNLNAAGADPVAELHNRLVTEVTAEPGRISDEIAKAVKVKAATVREALDTLTATGRLWKSSRKLDDAGQPVRLGGYYPNIHGGFQPQLSRPDHTDDPGRPDALAVGRPVVPSLRDGTTDDGRDSATTDERFIAALKADLDAEEIA